MEREFTTLEYLVLGLISMEPQSGYTIINYFEDESYSWSASPGSVYPMLKRLEKLDVLQGELEMTHDTRPRKIYTLTERGEQVLDEWLRTPPDAAPLTEEREKAMWKFLFMGKRFNTADVLKWLDAWEERLSVWNVGRSLFRDYTKEAMDSIGIADLRTSIHQQLLIEQNIMEVNMQRMWIQMARGRLMALGQQTGEHTTVSDS